MLFTLQISKFRYVLQFKFHHLMIQPDLRHRRAVPGPHWTLQVQQWKSGDSPIRMTRLRACRPTDFRKITRMGKIFFFSSKHRERIWGPQSYLMIEHRGISLSAKGPRRKPEHLPPISADVKNARSYITIPPHAFIDLTGKLYFYFTNLV